MLHHPDYVRRRAAQVAQRLKAKVYPAHKPIDRLLVAGPTDRIAPEEARRLASYRPAALGEPLGPLWATFWFRAEADVPPEWAGGRVDLLWITYGENTLYLDGHAAQGLNYSLSYGLSPPPQRDAALLVERARGGETLRFEIESACNGLFGEERAQPYQSVSPFVLDRAQIALFDGRAWALYHDLRLLVELEAQSQDPNARDLDAAWAGLLLAELNAFCNACDPDDPETWEAAGGILKRLYEHRNADAVHEISAIGHAHIDTAWLWPIDETRRKIERSWSSTLRLMEQYPELKFAASQAWQHDALKRRNPELYARVQEAARRGQWFCAGGAWVESDCNLPSGESLIRQMLLGQRFFEREFGRRCGEFWAPDVFGACGQLPQIMRHCGTDRFLTAKFSWNRFNTPDRHTFTWEGSDGSCVLAHYLPSDTYNSTVTVEMMRRNARAYRNHDLGRESLMVFGYGDGGGGPDERMLETLRRCRDLQGLPRTTIRSPAEFFDRIAGETGLERPRLVGELYLELHRGTYTTQAAAKRDNRRCEQILHDVEFLASVAWIEQGEAYPAEALDELWKLVLLNQFHDILPGSSIAEVYEQAAREYAHVLATAGELRRTAAQAVAGGADGTRRRGWRKSAGTLAPVNTLGFARRRLVDDPAGGMPLLVDCPPYGVGQVVEPEDAVRLDRVVHAGREVIQLENRHLAARFDVETGQLLSLVHRATGRESVEAGRGAGIFELYDDRPTAHDAWDIDPFHLETGRPVGPPVKVDPDSSHLPRRAAVRFAYEVGQRSRLEVEARLEVESERLEFHCAADWREDHQLLKVAFPLAVRAMNATYEMPFGVAERPTHFNTSYDAARFEVCGHRFADLSEPGFGVALLNESKYGHSCHRNVLRLSLLRAPAYPDPTADRGAHRFAYALYPHAGLWHEADVVKQAACFNQPPLLARGRGGEGRRSFFACENRNLVLDTIKRAEDEPEALVLRFYECHGARGVARVRLGLPFSGACLCNGLEDDGPAIELAGGPDGGFELAFSPFQIISVKLRR